MAEQICDPAPRCPECNHLNENGGECGGCFNEEGNRCLIPTTVETILERGPFTLGELDVLGKARETDNVKYLKNWSIAAVRFFEAEKRRLLIRIEELELKLKVL